MPFDVLVCPQCGATLPRQARWRMVPCPNCGAVVSRREDVVQARRIREAAAAQRAAVPGPVGARLRGVPYRGLTLLARSEGSEVHGAVRNEPFGERMVLKLARRDGQEAVYSREAEVLGALQRSEAPGFAHFTQRLPQPVAVGRLEGPEARPALALRAVPGAWGSLTAVAARNPSGLDPRHAVWMGRRVLEVLAFVHDSGWRHGDLAPEHLVVQPADHGVLIVGWARAFQASDADSARRDLRQVGWTLRALLAGAGEPGDLPAGLPAPLREFLARASEGRGPADARALDQELQAAAREAFGPPRFIPFIP